MTLRTSALAVASAMAALAAPGVAHAAPPVPRADESCATNLAGAMTWPTGDREPLACVGGAWQPVGDPYPISDRWLSYGPALTLHGEGRRNPTLLSGAWTATPLDPGTDCSATQLTVIPGSPTVGPPRTDRSATGTLLAFDVLPRLFSIELSGDCLWQRS